MRGSEPTMGLIADIGATNARFALADADGIHEEKILACTDYPNITEAVEAYYGGINLGQKPKAGAFAMAGPVRGDWFEMTNHGWAFSIGDTQKKLNFTDLRVMNDFEAVAIAVPNMNRKFLTQFGGEKPQLEKTIGVIGPGTGLGVASLVWGGQGYIPVPCEGGHVTMPAVTQREFDLIKTLFKKYHHISAERVCSGKGLVNLYNAIGQLDGLNLPDMEPKEISEAALNGTCPVCREALDLMLVFLGRVAGNLALTLNAFGGIYIAGGIPAKLGDYFFKSGFRDAFEAKGRYTDYMKQIPVFLINHPFIAFEGLRHDLLNRGRI